MKNTYLIATLLLFVFVQNGQSQDDQFFIDDNYENKKNTNNIDPKGFYIYLGYNVPIKLNSRLDSYGSLDMGFHAPFWSNKTDLVHIGADFSWLGVSVYALPFRNDIDDILFLDRSTLGPYFAVTKNIISGFVSYKVGFAASYSNENLWHGFAHDLNLGFIVKKFSVKTSLDMAILKNNGIKSNLDAFKFMIGFRM